MNLKLFKSFSLSLLQRASLPLFGFGTFYILVRYLNEDELGQWALFVAISTSLEGAKDGLMKNALVHYLNSTKNEDHVNVKSASLILNLIITGIFAVIILLTANWVANVLDATSLDVMLKFYAINLLALVIFSHFNFIQQAKVSYLGIMLSFMARQGVLFFTVLTAIIFFDVGLTLLELVQIQLVGIFLGTFISYIYTRKFLDHKLKVERNWMKRIWKFGRYGMLTNISVSIITSTDHFMLGGMISAATVGVYSVAVKITNFFNLPSVALSGVLLPEGVQTATAKNHDRLREIFEKAVATMLAGLIPSVLFVVFFPEPIISFIAGDSYIHAKEVLIIIILTTLIMPFFQNYGMIVNAMGKPKLDFIFISVISLFNIAANYFLINLIGITGAAYASLLTHVLGLLFIVVVLNKMIGISLLNVGKNTLGVYAKLFSMVLKRRKIKP